MIALCGALLAIGWLPTAAADGKALDEIRSLKADERNLLDDLDELYGERARLSREAERRNAELVAMRRVLGEEQRAVVADEKVAAAEAHAAHLTTLALQKLTRGGGFRFILAADSWGESLRRVRWVEAMLRRDASLLVGAEARLARSRERRDEWQRDSDYSAALVADVEQMQGDLATKNAAIGTALGEVRSARSSHEHALYESKESAAGRLDSEDQAALKDDFIALRGALQWPVRGPLMRGAGRQIDSSFGTITQQAGVLIGSRAGQSVVAIAEGKVVQLSLLAGYGDVLIVQHSKYYYSVYGGLGHATARVGEVVRQGQTIAVVGDHGQLFFDIRRRTTSEDPLVWLNR